MLSPAQYREWLTQKIHQNEHRSTGTIHAGFNAVLLWEKARVGKLQPELNALSTLEDLDEIKTQRDQLQSEMEEIEEQLHRGYSVVNPDEQRIRELRESVYRKEEPLSVEEFHSERARFNIQKRRDELWSLAQHRSTLLAKIGALNAAKARVQVQKQIRAEEVDWTEFTELLVQHREKLTGEISSMIGPDLERGVQALTKTEGAVQELHKLQQQYIDFMVIIL